MWLLAHRYLVLDVISRLCYNHGWWQNNFGFQIYCSFTFALIQKFLLSPSVATWQHLENHLSNKNFFEFLNELKLQVFMTVLSRIGKSNTLMLILMPWAKGLNINSVLVLQKGFFHRWLIYWHNAFINLKFLIILVYSVDGVLTVWF